jgi:hypothetical protein
LAAPQALLTPPGRSAAEPAGVPPARPEELRAAQSPFENCPFDDPHRLVSLGVSYRIPKYNSKLHVMVFVKFNLKIMLNLYC